MSAPPPFPSRLSHLQLDSGAGLSGVHKKEKGVGEGMTNDPPAANPPGYKKPLIVGEPETSPRLIQL